VRNIVILLFISISYLLVPTSIFGQSSIQAPVNPGPTIYEGKIEKIIEEKELEVMGRKQLYQKLQVQVTRGGIREKKVFIENGDLPIINLQRYKSGDEIKFAKSQNPDGSFFYYITDYVRRFVVLKLFIIFVFLVVLIGRFRGITSLFGLGVSLIVIIKFVLPQILTGGNPLKISILGSLIIAPITYYLSHGFNRKTTAALLGTLLSLIITGVLTSIFINVVKLSGFSSEEAGYLQVYMRGNLDIRGLLFAGIIIGVLGVMDDITISQSSIVEQLKKANPKLHIWELYKRAMSVGHDHIASMVNTLVLVYTGAALPLLLLFMNRTVPLFEIVDLEIIAEEVVRTLVGSIGLILAVPITTMIAVLFFTSRKKDYSRS
jgi:uncharacterized membrane protein